MITVDEMIGTANGAKMALTGKSTDEKPTEKYLGTRIDNGSTFFEIDTQAVKFYDLATNTWV